MLLYNFVIIARPDLFQVRVTSVNKSTLRSWNREIVLKPGVKMVQKTHLFVCREVGGDLNLRSLKFKNLELMTFESVEFRVESWVSLTQDV